MVGLSSLALVGVMRKTRRSLFNVSAFGKQAKIEATSAGNAVSKFCKRFRRGVRTDNETGGWKGVSVWLDSERVGEPQPVQETLAQRERRLKNRQVEVAS